LQYVYFGSLLEFVEIEKCSLFPERCLDRYARAVAEGVANAQSMEGPGTTEGLGWLRPCSRVVGEGGVCSGPAAMEIGGA
jgi:hypothetical protein